MKLVLLGENKSIHVQKWVQAISMYKEIELHVISFDRGVKFDNVTYHPLKIFLGNKVDYFLNVFLVKKYIKQIGPDLLHSHYASSYGFLGAFSGFHPYLITGWGADIFDSPKNYFMKLLLKYSFRKADAIAVLTEITRKEMLKLSGKPVQLIPFGVDLNKFTVKPKADSNKIRIGTIRVLAEKYGIEHLIKAFAIVEKKHSNIILDLVGDGPQKGYLMNLAKELKIEDKVIFHGFVNQNSDFEKYIKLLSNFDIFTILSVIDSETFGVAAVEASACSLPVIATNVGGLPEVIDDNKTGIIVPPRDVNAIAVALEKLISNKSLRIELGKGGRKKVEDVYDWKNNVQTMVDLYNKMGVKNIK
jgi:glycosyltransferase involved in cell wall biosynthesis